MEYSMQFGNAVMSLKAREVIQKEVDDELFTVPDDYQLIDDPAALDLII